MEKMYRILKKPFFGKYMGTWNNPLDREQERIWRPFSVINKSGVRINGLYFKSVYGKANIVLGHPMGKEAKGFFIRRGYTDFLIRNGYNVFVFDFNGFGESGTGNFDYPQDILAVGQKVKAMLPELPVGYLGVSMGASWGICALSQPGHVYSAAVFDSPFTSAAEFWRKQPSAYLALKVLGTFMPGKKSQLNSMKKVGALKGIKTASFICCLEDRETPLEMTLQLKEKSNVASELLVVNYNRHAMAYRADPSRYEEFVTQYFDKELIVKKKNNNRHMDSLMEVRDLIRNPFC